MISEAADAKFGQLQAADLGGYEASVRVILGQIMAVSTLPAHYVGVFTDNPASADALRAAEASLTARAEARQATFGRAWEQVAKLMVAVRDGVDPAGVACEGCMGRRGNTIGRPRSRCRRQAVPGRVAAGELRLGQAGIRRRRDRRHPHGPPRRSPRRSRCEPAGATDSYDGVTAVDAVAAFQAQTQATAVAAQSEVASIWAAVIAGQISRELAAPLIAGVINRANAVAVTLGDMFLSLQIEAATGVPTPVTGIAPRDDSPRLLKAVSTILDDIGEDEPPDDGEDEPDGGEEPDDDEALTRFDRLARSEPLETAQQAVHDAMQSQPLVEGWTRQMDDDPCQLCQWWSREGRVWPKAHPFQRHVWCNCQAKIVLAEHIQSTGYTRRLARDGR